MAEEVRSSETVRLAEIPAWDAETDVVVVGLGGAGTCAAIEAADAGAQVLAVERAGGAGGTSAQSGGVLYLGGGTPVQEACGFEDSPDEMFKFLMAACGPQPDEAKVRVYCDESVAHFHWLVDQGVPFKNSFYPEPSMESPTDDCLVFTGGEDTHPFTDIARPAARGHKPRTEGAAGAFLMQRLMAAVERRDLQCEFDVRADQLVVDDSGRVVGLVGLRAGTAFRVRARRGVVLTAGGFVLDDAMVAHHAPQVMMCSWRLSSGGDDGRAIRMGVGAGGAAIRMDSLECAIPLTPPRRLVRGIFVDASGQRFINESSYYGRIGQFGLFRLSGRFLWIHDEQTYEVNDQGMEVSWVADTVEELEAEIGLPEGALVSTVELYNRHAQQGRDPLFGKSEEFLTPLVNPPFGAIDVSSEKVTYATFTLGGLHTLPTGEVLTPDGVAVPGLYAAGRTTSGIAASGYVSGISLGDATYFGRKAGTAAAGG
ncbi:FAD-dependent oxidoreductase [Myxococcota bacterium]|nr:FAD-dependent oxidoreductase [Myxococcota bacterium]